MGKESVGLEHWIFLLHLLFDTANKQLLKTGNIAYIHMHKGIMCMGKNENKETIIKVFVNWNVILMHELVSIVFIFCKLNVGITGTKHICKQEMIIVLEKAMRDSSPNWMEKNIVVF